MIEIPGWVLSNVGGFVGFVIFSLVLFKLQSNFFASRERRAEAEAEAEAVRQEARQAKELRASELRQVEDSHASKRQVEKAKRRERLLPGPWITLYNYLHEIPEMTRDGVLLCGKTFKEKHRYDLPMISPEGFDMVLGVTYFNLPGSSDQGDCHEEFTTMFKAYVEFP